MQLLFPRVFDATNMIRPHWTHRLYPQEAQLSQKSRATIHVVGKFAKSLKVT